VVQNTLHFYQFFNSAICWRKSFFAVALFVLSAHAVAQDSARFAALDYYALQTPDNLSRSTDTLVTYLMIPAQNDLEKARLIYAWVAQHIKYDANAINANRPSDCSAIQVLKKKKAVCLGFAMLYEALGTEAGLNVRTIIGYVKGERRHARLKNPNHAWNAIEVNGRWILCDATWGSGYAEPKRKGKIKVKSYFNTFWFDTAPQKFVLSHLPDIPRWQLLSNQVSKQQFQHFPIIGSLFFEKGFAIDTIFDKLLLIPKYEVVEVYQTKGQWMVDDAHPSGILYRNQSYHFNLKSSYYDRAVVFSGNQTLFFDAINGYFDIDASAYGRKLSIFLIDSKRPKKAEGIFSYKVMLR
jgi:Transglutaminase-like superfamily